MKQSPNLSEFEITLYRLSLRLYRGFTLLYPRSFRGEYGPQMVQVFGDYVINTLHGEGAPGLTALWNRTLFDLFKTALEEHLQGDTDMSRSIFSRLGAWVLILGSLLLILSVYVIDNQSLVTRTLHTALNVGPGPTIPYWRIYELTGGAGIGWMLSMLLIGLGLTAVQDTYKYWDQGLALLMVRLAAVSSLLSGISAVLMVLEIGPDSTFTLFVLAMAAMFWLLGLFAVVTIMKQTVPRAVGLSLTAGLLVAPLMLFSIVSQQEPSKTIGLVLFLVACAGIILLGLALRVPDASPEILPGTG